MTRGLQSTPEPERWECQSCHASGIGRGRWNGTYKCPTCGKNKVMTNRCRHSSTPLCSLYPYGLGGQRHASVAQALRCEADRFAR